MCCGKYFNLKFNKMKIILYSLIAIIVFGIVASGITNMTDKKTSIIVQSADSRITSASLAQSATVISNRLKEYCPGNFELTVIPEKHQIKVQFPGSLNAGDIEKLMLLKGKLEFYETSGHKGLPGIFTEDVPVLTYGDIETIKFNEEGSTENFNIEIRFKESAKAIWAEATKRNLGKEISIVIDNNVICSPVTRSAIENGICLIAGKFSNTEVRYIVALVNNGEMPESFIIVK
jgi:preprotein translocase subunit SecD